MVEIDHKIVMLGIICLTGIYITLVLCDHESQVIGATIVGVIALAIGVIIPAPKIDNKNGVLKW